MKTRPNGRFTEKQKFVINYIQEKGEAVTQSEVSKAWGNKIHDGWNVPPSYNEAGPMTVTFKLLLKKELIEKENGKFKI